jgi:hypothetical protein
MSACARIPPVDPALGEAAALVITDPLEVGTSVAKEGQWPQIVGMGGLLPWACCSRAAGANPPATRQHRTTHKAAQRTRRRLQSARATRRRSQPLRVRSGIFTTWTRSVAPTPRLAAPAVRATSGICFVTKPATRMLTAATLAGPIAAPLAFFRVATTIAMVTCGCVARARSINAEWPLSGRRTVLSI